MKKVLNKMYLTCGGNKPCNISNAFVLVLVVILIIAL